MQMMNTMMSLDVKGDQIICLVDARKTMMSTHFEGNGDTHLANSLRVVLDAMKFKVSWRQLDRFVLLRRWA